MKKSKVLAAALAATMFATAACGLVACGDETETRYTVSFNAVGGVIDGAEALYTNASGIVKGTIPTAEKEDSSFRGWALSMGADESAVINFSTYKFDKDKTVYAVYKAYDVVTVTYDYGAGMGTRGSDTTVKGKLANLPTPLTPAGKKFDGWFTAATGGEQVTTSTIFTEDSTVYAQYSDNSGEYTNYCLVGDAKYELTEVTLEDAAQAFTVTVNLQANDSVSFYVDGQLISAAKGGLWIGMATVVGVKDVFTVESDSTYEFVLSCSAAATPTWTITGDSGAVTVIVDDYYLVGLGAAFGNWTKCLEENHFGKTSGEVVVTVGATPATFKLVKCKNRMGEVEWGGALGIDNVGEKGSGYVATDIDNNIVLETAGTYTIKLVGSEIEITSTDVEEPEITVFRDHYYVVCEEFGGWATCVEEGYIGKTSGEIELTVGATPVTFKVAKCLNNSGAINWDSALGVGAVTVGRGYVSTDKDKNIVLKLAGTYTVKLVNGKIQVSSDNVEEPPLTKDIDGYTYGAVVATKYCLVGGFIGEDFDATQGYQMKTKTNDQGQTEYMVEGFTVEAGGAVKIVFGATSYGYANIHEQWGNKGLAETDEDGNIVFKAAGTYSIFFNPTTGAIYLS